MSDTEGPIEPRTPMERANYLPAPAYFKLDHACQYINSALGGFGSGEIAMADIIRFKDRKSAISDHHFIEKIIDGKTERFVNFDALTQAQRRELFAQGEDGGAPEPQEPRRAVLTRPPAAVNGQRRVQDRGWSQEKRAGHLPRVSGRRLMRLADLDPHWLVADGKRMGLVFKCPHCQKDWLSCFFVPMPHISGDDYHDCQYALFATVLPEAACHEIVPCRRDFAWTANPPADQASFENLSITPSIDASAAGHWHGFVTAGEIR